MIELRIGWFAPHRAGGWWHWLGDAYVGHWPAGLAPTLWAGLCILGISVELLVGWGEGER